MSYLVIRDWGEPIAGQVMCAVPRRRKFPEHQRLREVLDAQQDFKPFRLAEACDQSLTQRFRITAPASTGAVLR